MGTKFECCANEIISLLSMITENYCFSFILIEPYKKIYILPSVVGYDLNMWSTYIMVCIILILKEGHYDYLC